MHQIRADGAFFDPAVQVAGIAATHSGDEVCKVIVRAAALRQRAPIAPEPDLVCPLVPSEYSVRSVEQVSLAVMLTTAMKAQPQIGVCVCTNSTLSKH